MSTGRFPYKEFNINDISNKSTEVQRQKFCHTDILEKVGVSYVKLTSYWFDSLGYRSEVSGWFFIGGREGKESCDFFSQFFEYSSVVLL